jgi:hypothetical protein
MVQKHHSLFPQATAEKKGTRMDKGKNRATAAFQRTLARKEMAITQGIGSIRHRKRERRG